MFLAQVDGRETLHFTVPGEFNLFATGEFLYYTGDDETTHNVVVAPVIFTRIANRRARNPNMEMMEFQMKLNLQRRMEQMERDALTRLNDTVNRYAAQRNIRTPPLDAGGEAEAERPEREGGEPSVPAAGKAAEDGGKGGKAGSGKKSAPAVADD